MRIPNEYSSHDYNMTIGDKISTGITIASGLAIAYVLEMHKEGKEVIPLDELKKFNGKQMLIDYGQEIKTEIIGDMNQLMEFSTSHDQKDFIEGKTLEILGLENTSVNRMFLDHMIRPVVEPFLKVIPTVGDHRFE